jgi:hypothetical protein
VQGPCFVSNLALWLPVLSSNAEDVNLISVKRRQNESTPQVLLPLTLADGDDCEAGELYLTMSSKTAISLTNNTMAAIDLGSEELPALTVLNGISWSKVGSVGICSDTTTGTTLFRYEVMNGPDMEPVSEQFVFDQTWCIDEFVQHFRGVVGADSAALSLNITEQLGSQLAHFTTSALDITVDSRLEAVTDFNEYDYKLNIQCNKRGNDFVVQAVIDKYSSSDYDTLRVRYTLNDGWRGHTTAVSDKHFDKETLQDTRYYV